jgi:hypothetical protein
MIDRFIVSDPTGPVLTFTSDEAAEILLRFKGDPENGEAMDAMLTQLEEWVDTGEAPPSSSTRPEDGA